MGREMSYNADDPVQVERAQKKADKEKFLRDETIRTLMSKKDGRAWVHHILSMADMWGNPIVREDSYATYNNIGMANLAKLIWMEIEEVVPESYALMIKEARENEKQEPSDAA